MMEETKLSGYKDRNILLRFIDAAYPKWHVVYIRKIWYWGTLSLRWQAKLVREDSKGYAINIDNQSPERTRKVIFSYTGDNDCLYTKSFYVEPGGHTFEQQSADFQQWIKEMEAIVQEETEKFRLSQIINTLT